MHEVENITHSLPGVIFDHLDGEEFYSTPETLRKSIKPKETSYLLRLSRHDKSKLCVFTVDEDGVAAAEPVLHVEYIFQTPGSGRIQTTLSKQALRTTSGVHAGLKVREEINTILPKHIRIPYPVFPTPIGYTGY